MLHLSTLSCGSDAGWRPASPLSMDAAALIREWMKGVLAEKSWTARKWAQEADLSPSTVQRPLKEDYANVTSTRTLLKLARAAGVSPPDIGVISASAPESMELPIAYEVAAGAWLASDEVRDEPYGYAEAQRVAPFADFPQWLERIVGDSIDRRIPPEALIHVVDTIALGYAPRDRDLVVVIRRRAGGQFFERSVKEVEVNRDGVRLWPRSHNPRWQEPLEYRAGLNDAEEAEVEIVGLVIRAYISTLGQY